MVYATLIEAHAAAEELVLERYSEHFGGVLVVRAIDGCGYSVIWGTPQIKDPTVFARGRHHSATIVEFMPAKAD